MKFHRALFVILLLAIIATVGMMVWNKTSGRRNQALQQPQAPATSVDTQIQEVAKLSVPKIDNLFLVCPFTNKANEITSDSLAVYFPTLFRVTWAPQRTTNTPFDMYICYSAQHWGLFKPGMVINEEKVKEFANCFECRNFVSCSIDIHDSKVSANLLFHKGTSAPETKTIEFPESELHLLPSKLAVEILGKMAISDAKLDLTYLNKPTAKTPQLLRKAAKVLIKNYNTWWDLKTDEYTAIVEEDREMDWFHPFYMNYLSNNNAQKAQVESAIAANKWKSPRFNLYHAATLQNNGENAKAAVLLSNILKKDPGNTKAWEVFANAVQELHKPRAAEPFFKKLVEATPDSSWSNYFIGSHKIKLAWEYRGSGYAYTVKQDGWEKFDKELREAKQYLEKSIELNPNNPLAYADLITIGMGMGLPNEEVNDYFKHARKLAPDNRAVYTKMQQGLLPKWGGSIEQLRCLWAEVYTYEVHNPFVYTIAIDAHEDMAWNYAYDNENKKYDFSKFDKYFQNEEVWNDVTTAYKYFFKTGIDSTQQRAVYGYFAYAARKFDLSFEQFELSQLKFEDTEKITKIDFLMRYIKSAIETGNYKRAEEVAQKGLDLNHCQKCNDYFRKSIEYVQQKMK